MFRNCFEWSSIACHFSISHANEVTATFKLLFGRNCGSVKCKGGVLLRYFSRHICFDFMGNTWLVCIIIGFEDHHKNRIKDVIIVYKLSSCMHAITHFGIGGHTGAVYKQLTWHFVNRCTSYMYRNTQHIVITLGLVFPTRENEFLGKVLTLIFYSWYDLISLS